MSEIIEPNTARTFVANLSHLARGEPALPMRAGEPVELIVLQGKTLHLGQHADQDVVLDDAAVSPRHAVLEPQAGGYFLHDLGSQSGTFVNGKSIARVRLEPGDLVHLGPYLFCFKGTHLAWRRPGNSPIVAVAGLCQSAGDTPLLEDIWLLLQPGEFVGLLGPSGVGKTTLLDAVSGLRPARSGQVYVGGEPLYKHYERLKSLFGYVPQHDLVHRELTCRGAFTYVAQLRLPSDASATERRRAVEEAMTTLDLAERADVPIAHLSGGQRKRASVGVELLNKPLVLFLDEPTSGLDPGTEARLMRTFQQLARQGRTVVCTTHIMENVALFDKIAVLVPGGRLGYFGPPAGAKEHFGIERFPELYERLEEKSPQEWQEVFRRSPRFQELQRGAAAERVPRAFHRQGRHFGSSAAEPRAEPLRQWSTLTRRFATILAADPACLLLPPLQALFIAGLICLVFRDLPSVFFLLVISALWFGCSLAAQQIVKERGIYRRERAVNLRLDAYILSKFLPLALVGAGQCLLMLGVVWLWKGFEGKPIPQLVSLVLASWNGISGGLILSALAANADKATSYVPLALLPQIILGGVLVPLPDMNPPTRLATQLVAAKWANQALEISLLDEKLIDVDLLGDDANWRPLWNLYPDDDLRKEEGRRRFLQTRAGTTIDRTDWLVVDGLVLAVFVVCQLGVVGLVLRRQDVW